MPHLPHSIELHDSDISEISFSNGALAIAFAPAIVHHGGSVFTQEARLVVRDAEFQTDQIEFPVTCSMGLLRATSGPYKNLLYLPLDEAGPVSMRIEFTTGNILTATGSSVAIILFGSPSFLEHFP